MSRSGERDSPTAKTHTAFKLRAGERVETFLSFLSLEQVFNWVHLCKRCIRRTVCLHIILFVWMLIFHAQSSTTQHVHFL